MDWRACRGLGAGGGERGTGGVWGLGGGRRWRTANGIWRADGLCEGGRAHAWGRPASFHVRFCLCTGGDCLCVVHLYFRSFPSKRLLEDLNEALEAVNVERVNKAKNEERNYDTLTKSERRALWDARRAEHRLDSERQTLLQLVAELRRRYAVGDPVARTLYYHLAQQQPSISKRRENGK